jgi:thiamine-monophosphate kinase
VRLRDVSEGELLARVFPVYAGARPAAWGSVPVGPGDDAAVVGTPGGSVVATTDSMVRGRDWRDEWSSAHDVGVKVAAQNLADVAAMGAVPTALLVSFVADPDLEVEWAVDLARGIASLAEQAGAPVVGGDLSSAPSGVVVVSVTALGELRGLAPVLRSGARHGDVVAVCGTLGWSGGGLALFERGEPDPDRVLDAGVPGEGARLG